jgi:dTMP kinase
MSGIFVSFEGIDGAGKSTHIERLAQAFRECGRTVTLTREPGGTPLAEQLRHMVLNEAMDPMTEALLVFAARRDHIQRVILPALQRGDVILCDRFTDASFAYQGAGRGFNWDILSVLENWVQGMPTAFGGMSGQSVLQPDITLWFDLAPAIAAQRLAGARVPDKFESQPVAFFESVASGYARRMDADPTRFVRLNADQKPDTVWQDLFDAVRVKGLLG